ncbi:hypothetical protein PIB30_101966, partial [Stylosanthes scabra]|nr:hypothetical protein [Stylosanthes scabra]
MPFQAAETWLTTTNTSAFFTLTGGVLRRRGFLHERRRREARERRQSLTEISLSSPLSSELSLSTHLSLRCTHGTRFLPLLTATATTILQLGSGAFCRDSDKEDSSFLELSLSSKDASQALSLFGSVSLSLRQWRRWQPSSSPAP